jgi:ribose 5-phosphate isomerase B
MKIVIAADHGGLEYKNILLKNISAQDYAITDLGAFENTADDYPDHAAAIAYAILNGEAERGIVICGSGVGVCVAVNKFKGIRAGVCHDTYSAHQSVEHDDTNVLCLGQRVIGIEAAKEIALAFLSATFSNEERHQRRLDKIKAIENKNFK